MSREFVLEQLQKAKPVGGGLLCWDESYNYYQLGVLGRLLMYRQKRFKPDGRRGYYLTDELARALFFENLVSLKCCLTTLQYWRGFISVERLRVALQRYNDRQALFRKMAREQGLI